MPDLGASTLRRFNRTYTQRVGALEESFLGTGFPLGVTRLLFEIGPDHGAAVRELRDRLDLDSGYLTRLLRRLTDEGLAEITPDPSDGRRRVVASRRRAVGRGTSWTTGPRRSPVRSSNPCRRASGSG
jgi:DNA-binding MarR family transcriptional regulator